jgi:2-polyprenyl-6-methoxyphenol hydroxylase-like FAD-dependent oxidoreductase
MNTTVIIIGAGPTGLMAACQLARFGVDMIIIDAKAGVNVESRAI